MAGGFEESHERMVAIEWLLGKLAAEHCLAKPDPLAEANRLIEEGEIYSQAISAVATKSGVHTQFQTAVSIGTAIGMLLENVRDDVEASL